MAFTIQNCIFREATECYIFRYVYYNNLYLDVVDFVLLISKSTRCFSGDWENNSQSWCSHFFFCNPGYLGLWIAFVFLFYFFDVTRDTGTWEISCCCPLHGSNWAESHFWCILFLSSILQVQCSFAKVTSSSPSLCFVFEQRLKLQNDVCILVCLMLTCAERQNMDLFQ